MQGLMFFGVISMKEVIRSNLPLRVRCAHVSLPKYGANGHKNIQKKWRPLKQNKYSTPNILDLNLCPHEYTKCGKETRN
jgi:hypothetical protein